MIKGASIIILFLSGFNVVAGNIQVKVLSSDSNKPVPSATVYLNKTTIGGITDSDGNVEITDVPFGVYELSVSEINHKPYTSQISVESDQPQYYSIKIPSKEATVESKHDDKWNRDYVRFQKLFFGSAHVNDCHVTNPSVLEFRIAQGYFIASASDPLKIENNYLGYDIEFRIKTCAFRAQDFSIAADIYYKEKEGNDSLKTVWRKNREHAYRGSQQHFFRSLLDGSMTKEGFEILSDVSHAAGIVRYPNFIANLGSNLTPISLSKNITPNPNGSYNIKMPSRLEIRYKGKQTKTIVYRRVNVPISWMETKGDTLIVSGNGFVRNPQDLTMHGGMSDTRVTEWLPLNYQYTGTEKPLDDLSVESTALLEKPYIQTDRNYYYTGETLWLKGYMNYSMPLSRDTLSQSVYVDLVDVNNNIVAAKRYLIEDGLFNGDIVLDQNLPAGLYQLRSYTAWMLNFDPKFIFTKTINVLNQNQAVKIQPDYSPKQNVHSNISLATDKTAYAAREKITLIVDVFDSLDFRTISDLSIAVTDIEQVVPITNEKTILKNYFFDGTENKPKKIEHNIEYGIDFAGQFRVGRKPVKAGLTVFQENSTENFAIVTDDSGGFSRSLIFKDTARFYLKAMSYNNRRGIVKMSENKAVCPKREFEAVTLDVYPTESSHRPFKLDEVNVLDEVTIKSTKLEKQQPGTLHGQSDYTITSEWFNEHPFNDIFLAIVARAPGLRYNNDPLHPVLNFVGSMNLRTYIPPLILVDNVPTDAALVATIPVRTVERIDVVKSAGAVIYGSKGAGGVIAIYTKRGMIEEPQKGFDKTKFQEVKLFGYSSTSAFKDPDYSKSEQDGRLDYRATIYWSPFVTTDGKAPAKISFYAADVATKYRVVVEGITAAGIPVRAEKVIEVLKAR